MGKPFYNIGSKLERLAKEIPETPAILVPRKRRCETINFLELHREANRLASGLSRLGISKGQRVLLMVRPGIPFIALTFALFRIGAVAVLIDPGLGRNAVLDCIGEVEPEGMIAISIAHAARMLFPKYFETVRISVTVGPRWFWGGPTLEHIRKTGHDGFEPAGTFPQEPAAILFTSGSTGPPKGVLYTHEMFSRQAEILQTFYGFKKGEVDLPTFPLFALFSAALGMTSVVPEMDPTQPAKVDPRKIVAAIRNFGVTSSFGSPALWDTVSRYCIERHIRLPGIRRILMAGAPISGSLLKRFENILDRDGEIFTPYGATEALPAASIDWTEILRETWEKTRQGRGVCVGRAVPGIRIKIIPISDTVIPAWDDSLELPPGSIGEIVARGPWVTREYFKRRSATELAIIRDGKAFWRRMGDVGYLDEQGRLWFCGRKSHRVICKDRTLYTIPCEGVFNRHPNVKRSALVGVGTPGAQRPAIVIEPALGRMPRSSQERRQFIEELMALGASSALTRNIKEVLFHPSFPVDIRHNAKIFREKLARWAGERLESR
ncbi:MAG: fatty acid CoA ligase family protein [Nitrospinales bacterium]